MLCNVSNAPVSMPLSQTDLVWNTFQGVYTPEVDSVTKGLTSQLSFTAAAT